MMAWRGGGSRNPRGSGRAEQQQQQQQLERIKVCVVGEKGAGKTALLRRCLTGSFTKRYEPTLTCEKHATAIRYEGRREPLALELWDSPGGLGWQSLADGFRPSPTSNAHAAIICYDMTCDGMSLSAQLLHSSLPAQPPQGQDAPCAA